MISAFPACTAAVTKISYYRAPPSKPTFIATISYLTLSEWEEEFKLLVRSVNDDIEELGEAADHRAKDEALNREDTKVAWAKVRAAHSR